MSEQSPYTWIREAQQARPRKWPVRATIVPYPGGEYEVYVWPDWIEEIEEDDPYEPDIEP